MIRGAKLKSRNQHLYPLELSCNKSVQTPPETLNADEPVYRPRRDAAAAARFRIQVINDNEQLIMNNAYIDNHDRFSSCVSFVDICSLKANEGRVSEIV